MAKAKKRVDSATTESKQSSYTTERLAGLKPFQPGQSGNPKGRKPGSRNKVNEDFLRAITEDFATNGKAAIEAMRTERPHEYVKVVASLLPKEVNINTNAFEDMTEDELASGIAALQSFLAAQGNAEGSEAETRH